MKEMGKAEELELVAAVEVEAAERGAREVVRTLSVSATMIERDLRFLMTTDTFTIFRQVMLISTSTINHQAASVASSLETEPCLDLLNYLQQQKIPTHASERFFKEPLLKVCSSTALLSYLSVDRPNNATERCSLTWRILGHLSIKTETDGVQKAAVLQRQRRNVRCNVLRSSYKGRIARNTVYHFT